MPIVLKSGSLNLLESSGPVQACNGIAVPFYLTSCNKDKDTKLKIIKDFFRARNIPGLKSSHLILTVLLKLSVNH